MDPFQSESTLAPPGTTSIPSPPPIEINAIQKISNDDDDEEKNIKLPQALEKVLALKTVRAQQLGVDPDSEITPFSQTSQAKGKPKSLVAVDEVEDDEGDEEVTSHPKESKNKRRKKKKKRRARQKKLEQQKDKPKVPQEENKENTVDVDVEYVMENLEPTDPLYAQFVKIFEKFKLTESDKGDEKSDEAQKEASREPVRLIKKPADLDESDSDSDYEYMMRKEEENKPKLSKRKLKKLNRMSIAELKQKVSRPELVEMHDVTAKDPVLLLQLKATRNTVPVPRHWCFKRKYLQGKRGIEKPPFELPDFIKRTGIMEMRQALQEKEDEKTLKAKMRERVRPKLGKIDIDYQKLHDAFFKWQTKPRMTIHGDLYYEGKELETRLKDKKPGELSDELRVALGMPTGPNANKCPPPWLIAMQRYGPPPSYPNLKIPGLNAPIPDSCSFGYHAGGWGKPPVDEFGRPLYGDVFGTQLSDNQPQLNDEDIDRTLWGELESESSEEEEDEEEEDEEEEEKAEDETGLVTPAEGLVTPSGFSSIPAGMETPDMIELRKRKIEAEMEGGETPALYTILPEKKSEKIGSAMMGSTHIYDLSAAIPGGKPKTPGMVISGTTSVPPHGIEVALDPSELEMDTAAMAARYEQTVREQQSHLQKEDLSDMVAEHAARQRNKRKKQQQDSGKAPKKYKEFKF
ncbi:splicing factor 3B subunit 2 [Centruroides vittatus]|uniref:splicing factor 3B subunit 2 n=1 Tax=Centruroides vittatus TaxID=120091 RepID=UPI0035106AF0